MRVLKSMQPSNKYPESWEIVSFIEAVEDLTGGNPKVNQNQYLDSGLFPVIDQGKDEIAGYVNDERLLCKTPLPCIIFGDHTKIFKRIDTPFVLGADGVKVLKPKKDFDINFIYYYLKLIRLPNNAGYSRHFKFLKEYEIPKPPIEKQKRIADILDKAEALSQKRQQATELADQFLRSAFLDMFGDPVNNPKSWPSTRLLDVCEKITDGEHLNPKFEKTGVPIAMAGDVLKSGINFEKVKFVSQKDFEKFSRKCLPEHNDLLLVSRGATIGRCSLVNTTRPFSLMGSVILIKPKRDLVCPYFLANLFWHPGYKAKLYKTSSSSAQQAIYLTHLRELTIPLPSLKAQKKFELLCEKIFSMISQRINYELKTRDLFNSLTQRAFRGEL